MSKNKLFRFAEMKKMDHVLEPTMDAIKDGSVDYPGKWNQDYFKNDHPVVLELGCGKGEYTVGLSKKHPEKNFVGVDIKGARMYVGALQCQEENIGNAIFLRTKVDFIDRLFSENEVDEIWLTFSDPQPNKPNKRLTSRVFIDRYRKILRPGGKIHLKTDSDLLYESTLEEIEKHGYNCIFKSDDIYRDLDHFSEELKDILQIKTHYEDLFSNEGHIIKYCQFTIDEG